MLWHMIISVNLHFQESSPKIVTKLKKNAVNFAYTLKPTLLPFSDSPISVPLWPQKNLIIEMRSLGSLN